MSAGQSVKWRRDNGLWVPEPPPALPAPALPPPAEPAPALPAPALPPPALPAPALPPPAEPPPAEPPPAEPPPAEPPPEPPPAELRAPPVAARAFQQQRVLPEPALRRSSRRASATRRAAMRRRRSSGARLLAELGTVALALVLLVLLPAESTGANALDPISQADLASAYYKVLPYSTGTPPSSDPPRDVVITPPGMEAGTPFIYYHKGIYYLYSSQWASYKSPNVPVRVSTGLVGWHNTTDVLPKLPPWAQPLFTWAPWVRRYGPHDYVLYFTAMRRYKPYDECIGASVGTNPLGPFRAFSTPMICQTNQFGDIDPRPFVAANGQLWMVWKSDDNHGGITAPYTKIWAQRLSANGLQLLGQRHIIFTVTQPSWEGRIVEAPMMVYYGGLYWLFFSANGVNTGSYAIGVAKCTTVAGPCFTVMNGPWVRSGRDGPGPGEESVFQGPKGRLWFVYNAECGINCGVDGILQLKFNSWGPYLVTPTLAELKDPGALPRVRASPGP